MRRLDIPTREGLTDLVHGFADVRADAQLGPLFDRAIGAHWTRTWSAWWSSGAPWRWARAASRATYSASTWPWTASRPGISPSGCACGASTERVFAPEVAHELQTVAHGIARNLFRGYFG
jgi:hemoglobin